MSAAVVVGGSGFIGSRLVRALAGSGVAVTVLDREEPPAEVAALCTYRSCDVTRPSTLRGAFDGAEVVHLAAALLAKECDEAPSRCWAVNVAGTVNVLSELVSAAAPPRVVFLSTGNVYGDAAEYPVTEDAATVGTTLYARSKVAGERAVAAAAAAAELSAAILRLFTVYGPGPAAGVRGHFVAGWLERVLGGAPLTIFGDGSQTVDLTHVDDVVRACVLAAAAPIPTGDCRVYNVGSGVETAVRDVSGWLRDVFPSLEVQHAPARWAAPARQLAGIARARAELGYVPRVSPEDGVKALARSAFVEV